MLDARKIAARGGASEDGGPVTVAVYTLQVVMNEEDPTATNEQAIEAFANEFQNALDNFHFVQVRYDALDFEVVSRIPVATIEPGEGGS
jgi:hypothetical protein